MRSLIGSTDGTPNGRRFARIDKSTHELIVIQNDDHKIHDGDLYFIKQVLSVAGGDGAVIYMMFTTPDTVEEIHAKANFPGSEVEFTIEIYEGGNVSADKVEIPFVNANRRSNKSSPLKAYAVAELETDDDEGDLIWQGKVGVGKSSGISNRFGYEILSNRNTTYLFKITKEASTNPAWLDVDFFYYVHTPFN